MRNVACLTVDRAGWILPLLLLAVGSSASPHSVGKPFHKDSRSVISFNNDVEPILTRLGCNQGACHGAQYGKGGFKLSLAAFDSELDYSNLVKQSGGRRVCIAEPAASLLLLKPLMRVRHGGGMRLNTASPLYGTLIRWLQNGAPGPDPRDPILTRIEVNPGEKLMMPGSAAKQLKVRADYSDGSARDVTSLARLTTLNDGVAACTPEGRVSPTGKGQTAIMVRFSGLAAVSTVIVPYGTVRDTRLIKDQRNGQRPKYGSSQGDLNLSRILDSHVERKQRQLGLKPSPLCDDRTFARRVFFDLIGTAPTPDEILTFLADRSPSRRDVLVTKLLSRPEYADYWALKWGDLLRCNRTTLGNPKGMWSFFSWIHSQFENNRPADQLVHDLILAQGSTFTNGPANYYRVAQNPPDLAETTSQVFLGVRMQCARCHHHPFERWSQTDYYQFAAFFARVGIKSSNEFGQFGNEQIVKIQNEGEVTHPKTGAVMRPTPLEATLAVSRNTKLPDPDADGDRRRALADWITRPDNRLFARNLVNRYWGALFGKGIYNPVDDQRITNPPTNPQLLDTLASDLIHSHFDLKRLLRTICATHAYQRASEATSANRQDELFFTHALPRRLPAEVLLDAIDFACGVKEKFPELPRSVRAIQLPDSNVNSDFLDTFGRPQRLIACECERTAEPNLAQTLRLMNGDTVNSKIGAGEGRLSRLIAAGKPDGAILQELYLTTLGRPPRNKERVQVLGALIFASDRKAIFEDVLLTLINSKEFLFNH